MPTGVVVDDHDSFRRAACRLLAAAGCEVVGEAADVQGAVDVVVARNPDVVLLDVLLADGTAADVVARLRSRNCTARVLLTSSAAPADLPVDLAGLPFIAKADLSVETVSGWVTGA